ncbi:MAG: hypothetical protein LBE35_08620 [Clostridiales bacterium]|jgi:hypothetical protein|nr:hypothetical protein [Clostridiales bacterium]
MTAKGRKIGSLIIAGIAVAALALVLFLSLRTVWQPTFSEVDDAAMWAIINVLDEEGIRSRANLATGVIYVPSGHADRAWLVVQRSPELRSGRINLVRAIEEAGGIMSFSGKIDFPLLLPSNATINLFGDNLPPEIGEMAASIAAGNVPGLLPENITVIYGAAIEPPYSNDGLQVEFEEAEDAGEILPFPEDIEVILARVHGILPGLMTQDFPGGPIYSGYIPEEILRHVHNTIQEIEIDGIGVLLETWEHLNPSNFPGGPIFDENFVENFPELSAEILREIGDRIEIDWVEIFREVWESERLLPLLENEEIQNRINDFLIEFCHDRQP